MTKFILCSKANNYNFIARNEIGHKSLEVMNYFFAYRVRHSGFRAVFVKQTLQLEVTDKIVDSLTPDIERSRNGKNTSIPLGGRLNVFMISSV